MKDRRRLNIEGGLGGGGLRAYERWTWGRCRDRVLSLKGRLGYQDRLWVLGYDLSEDGCLLDPYRGITVFDPAEAVDPRSIPYNYSGVPEMYMLMYVYAEAKDRLLTGEHVDPGGSGPLRRFELGGEEAGHLLGYAEADLEALRSSGPFIGEMLGLGDFSFMVWPLPRVPVSAALWRGDEETGCGGSVFFDGSVVDYLPRLEVELAGLTVWRLRNMLDPGVRWGYHQYK
jgi:hypothetical protein